MLKKETKTKAQKKCIKKKIYVSLNKKRLFDSEQVKPDFPLQVPQLVSQTQYYNKGQEHHHTMPDKFRVSPKQTKNPQKTKQKNRTKKLSKEETPEPPTHPVTPATRVTHPHTHRHTVTEQLPGKLHHFKVHK